MLDLAVVGIAQWLPRPGDAAGNLATALDLIAELGRRRCDLILLPELWPSGYSPASLAGDVARSAEPLDGARTAALAGAAASAGAWLAAGSVPERDGADVYNTALLFGRDGELRGVHRKAHLYAPLGEDLIFAAGPRLTVCPTEDFGPLGLPVCFDGDFPETARALRLAGARVIAQASAYEAEAESWWDRLYPARALENGQWWVMSNQCGGFGPPGTPVSRLARRRQGGDRVAGAGVVDGGPGAGGVACCWALTRACPETVPAGAVRSASY